MASQGAMAQAAPSPPSPSEVIFSFLLGLLAEPFTMLRRVASDPLGSLMELVVVFFLAVLTWLLLWHRDRVFYLLTGDPVLHCDPLDVGASTLQCCCGDGEWTRWITSLPCCCAAIYKHNLVTALGQLVGVRSIPVKLSNIVVGDLPGLGRNSYYICIECKTDPQMASSVAEQKLPKVVHFPEIFIVRLRKSILEWHIRISIRRLTAIGHEELCEVFFSWQNILEWCEDADHQQTKRFQMKSLAPLETESVPWVSLRFQFPSGDEHGAETLLEGQLASYCYGAEIIWSENEKREEYAGDHSPSSALSSHFSPTRMVDFKSRYRLLDPDGNEVREPNEKQVRMLYFARYGVHSILHFLFRFLVLLVVVYSIFRYYSNSCYTSYRAYTMLINNNHTWQNITLPISNRELNAVEAYCMQATDGGLDVSKGTPCKPSFAEVQDVCLSPPSGQRPTAFTRALNRAFDMELDVQVPCPGEVCQWHHDFVAKYDVQFVICIGIGIIIVVVLRLLWNICMRKVVKRQMRNPRSDDIEMMQSATGSPQSASRGNACCVVM